jgi:hypothetical protein
MLNEVTSTATFGDAFYQNSRKMAARRRNQLKRATGAVIESLERRTLFSTSISW